MIKKLAAKLLRLAVLSRLRARNYRRPLNLKELTGRCSLNVDRSLDIGSGPNPKNPFEAKSLFGVDIRSWDISANVKRCLLGSEPIPFESNFFDVVTAYDVLEHIPRVATEGKTAAFPFVSTMNEIWRVLKVDGLFYSETPCYPMQEAFQDPTHVNVMTEDTLRLYFAENAWARIYGFIGCFSLVAEGWCGSHYFCILKKTSDVPLLLIDEPQVS